MDSFAETYYTAEERRRKALDTLPRELNPSSLEANPVPSIVYNRDIGIRYANPAAMKAFDYNFAELSSFNNVILRTGPSRKRLDQILQSCADKGWNELDLSLLIETLDRKALFTEPHLKRVAAGNETYWIAQVERVAKYDPSVETWIRRLQREIFTRKKPFEYVPAGERIDKGVLDAAIKGIADPQNNVVVDCCSTLFVEKQPLDIFADLSRSQRFGSQLYIVNAPEILCNVLKLNKVNMNNVFPRRVITHLSA